MYNFSIVAVGPEALQINFIQPHADTIVEDIKKVLEKMGAVLESSHHNTYMDEYVSWYKTDKESFTFSDLWGKYSLYAQGDNVMIAKIASALIDSGLFTKIEEQPND